MRLSPEPVDAGSLPTVNCLLPYMTYAERARRVTLVYDNSVVYRPTRGGEPLIFDTLEVPRSTLQPDEARPLVVRGKGYCIRAFSGPGDNHQR